MYGREAEDYLVRLNDRFRLDATTTALDFSCGFGAVAERLAEQGVRLKVWDRSRNMCETALERWSRFPNAGLLELKQSRNAAENEVDFVLVNSVIQYMTSAESQS